MNNRFEQNLIATNLRNLRTTSFLSGATFTINTSIPGPATITANLTTHR
jgi:hypothetical protein